MTGCTVIRFPLASRDSEGLQDATILALME
jgi:hypothetical protein